MSELLTDGSFETWTSAMDLTNWTEDGDSGTATRSVDREGTVVYNGTYALKLSEVSNDGTTDLGVYQDVTVVAQTSYVLQGLIRFTTRTAGYVKIEAYDQTGSVIIAQHAQYNAYDEWQHFRMVLRTPASCVTLRLKIYLMDGTTETVYFDMFSLATAPAYTTVDKVKARFLAANISAGATDGNIAGYIDQAVGVIDSTTLKSFAGNVPQIVEQCATDLAAFYVMAVDPSLFTNNSEAALVADMFWAAAERALRLLSDGRVLGYLNTL